MSKKIAIIFPCLNEEKTLEKCIDDTNRVMKKSKYKNDYEILVCDNGSTDSSVNICEKRKTKYVIEKKRGYGNALLLGIKKAIAKYIVMLDCDMSYEIKDIPKIVGELEKGNDLVMGNRFKGKIEAGAMPFSHRIGSRLLTEYANLLFRTKAHDLHCGLRGFDRKKIIECNLESSGFEFASEMVIKAKKNKLKISEISTNLYKDGRNRKPHLRTIRDGFRHLHTINKTKYELSKPFRYVSTFLISIFAISVFTFCSALIPHDAVRNNVIQSVDETIKSFKVDERDPTDAPSYRRFERYGDVRNYTMAYKTDSANPLKSAIEMNYPSFCDYLSACKTVLERNEGALTQYGRYWQGQSAAIHYLLPFMTANAIILIVTIIFVLLYAYTVYKLYKEDKLLSAVFVASSLAINLPFTTRSLQFIPIMFIMLIATLLILHSKKHNSKNMDIIFLLAGIFTCYFDFLTSETLSLTIPLFVYAYLEYEDGRKVALKTIIKMALLWGVGYAGTFLVKWLIDYLYIGERFIKTTMNHLFNNTMGLNAKLSSLDAILNNFVPILPFALFPNGTYGIIGITIICVLYIVFAKKKYLPLLLICIIPVLRFAAVRTHSMALNYFTYRALLPLIMLDLMAICSMIRNTFSKTDE